MDDETELVQCPALIRREQKDRLDRLHRRTRIPRNVLIRESIDDLLEKYERRWEHRTGDRQIERVTK